MADEARITALVEQLNEALGDVTPYKLAVIDPASLEPIDKNAHYMPKRTYEQLVANIKRDGNLSTLPFCWRRHDGVFVVLSGNHRVEAAKGAHVPLIMVLYTDALLSRSERRAVQLSHNALVGKDNPQLLRELYGEIDDLVLQLYSGIDDSTLATLTTMKLETLSEAHMPFEELTFLFLPTEVSKVKDIIERIGRAEHLRYAMRVEDFARFFDLLLTFKDASNILNSSTALLAMCDIVDDWLATTHKEALSYANKASIP